MTKNKSAQDKELQRKSWEGNLKNAKKEFEMITKQLKDQKELLEFNIEGTELTKRMHAEAMKGYEYVNPTFKFQMDPTYVGFHKQWSQVEHRLKLRKWGLEQEQFENNIKNLTEQLESTTKLIAELEEKLKSE